MTEELKKEENERELYDTLEQERILLKCLFTQQITASKYFSKIKEALFTSPQRVWMFRQARKIFKNTANLFSDSVISSELDRIKNVFVELQINNKNTSREISHTDVLAEWNMISGTEISNNTAEWLIDNLQMKLRARLLMVAAENAIDKVLKGESDEAISDLNSDVVSIRSNINKNKPLRRLSDPDWQVEIIRQKQENPDLYAVLKTGLPSFDSLAGLYRGEITLITAHTGVGKSTLMRSMALGAAKAGLNVLFIVNEEIEDQTGAKFAVSQVGSDKFPYRSLKRADKETFNEDGIKNFSESLREFGRVGGEVFIQELSQFHTCADIEEILVDMQQQGERIDIIFLDYLDHLKPMEKAWSDIDEQNKAIAEFKSVCMQFRIAGVTATQADTASVESDNMNAYNVRGSKQKSGAANIVMAIRDLTAPEEIDGESHEVAAATWKIMILKNRDGAKFSFLARFVKVSGLVKEKTSCSSEEICTMERDFSTSKKIGGKGKKGKGSGGRKSPSDMKTDGVVSVGPSSKKEKEEIKEESRSVAEMTDIQDDFDEMETSKSTESNTKPNVTGKIVRRKSLKIQRKSL